MASKYWGVASIFGLILLGKASGLFKDLMITYYHGVSTVTDAYFLSHSIASLLHAALYAAVPVLIVPMYSKLIANREWGRVNQELSAGLSFFLCVSLAIAFWVIVSADQFVAFFSGEIDEEVEHRAANYLSIMAFGFALSTMVAFFNAIQTVNRVVRPAYIVPVINNGIFCIGLYLFNGADEFPYILMLGVAAWFILAVANGWDCKAQFRVSISFAFDFFSNKQFLLLFLPAILAFYIEQMNGYIGVYFASELWLGAISVYSYANKVNMVFLSVFVVFLTVSLFPKIAALSGMGSPDALHDYLTSCIRAVVIVAVPAVIYMYLYSSEIVTLIYQRGEFSEEDAARVSVVFGWVVLGLPFCLLRDTLNRVFFSNGDTLTPALMSLFAVTLNFLVCYLSYEKFGLSGISIAAVVSVIFNCGLALVLTQYRMNIRLLMPFSRILFVSCTAGLLSGVALQYFGLFFASYWALLWFPFGLLYILILFAMGVREVRAVRELVGLSRH